jgi:hypothetical protein
VRPFLKEKERQKETETQRREGGKERERKFIVGYGATCMLHACNTSTQEVEAGGLKI